MSKENFSWKSLFVNDSNENAEAANVVIPASQSNNDTKFPTAPFTSTAATNLKSINNPFLGEILDVYEKGLNSLNLPDFDFFELYKSVIAVGSTTPQSYQMAFTMGKTIKSDLSKEFLLEKSRFYISEIEKVYSKYDSTGKAKKQELDTAIIKEKTTLSKNISDLEAQIASLQIDLESKRLQFSKIDSRNSEQYSQIEMKIEANNFAKQKILESINIVVAGINQYL